MALCTYNLNADIDTVCDLVGGLQQSGYLINKADLASFTSADHTISAITLATTKKAYKIYVPTKTPFTGTNVALTESDVVNRFTNTVSFIILNNNDDTVEALNNLANGKYIAIIANEYTGTSGETKWQAYGIERGLRANAITRDPYDDASSGGYTVTMAETGAANAGWFVYSNSETATDTMLEALCTPAV